MKKLFLLLNIICVIANCFSQIKKENNIEDLRKSAYDYIDINLDTAKFFAEKALSLSKNNKEELCYSTIALATVFFFEKDHTSALKYYLQAQDLIDTTKYTKNHFTLFSNLGIIYFQQKETTLALSAAQKSKLYADSLKNDKYILNSINNIASVYYMMEDYQRTLVYYEQELKLIKEKNLNYDGLPILYINIGKIYAALNNYEKTKEFYFLSYNECDTHEELITKAKASTNLMELFSQQKNFTEAIKYFNITDSIFRHSDSKEYEEVFLYKAYNLFVEMKDFEKALFYLNKYYEVTDEMYSSELDMIVNELKTKYEVEKISNESKNKDLIIKEQEKYNNLLFWVLIGSIVFAVVAIVFTIILIINGRQKNKLNKLLSKTNDQLEKTNKEIDDNMIYARKIQESFFANDMLQQNMNFFVIDKPKFKVGGDFYLFLQKGDRTFWGLGDCTGHGISGGFLSTLGYQFLSRALEIHTDLNDVLNFVNQQFYNNISSNENLCGESLCLSIVCFYNNKIEIAGSKHKVWKFDANSNEIIEYQTNKEDIGHSENMEFDIKTDNISENDYIFLSSDGFPDQFGENGKIKYKNFREWLKIAGKFDVIGAKKILEGHLLNWQGNFEQTDDILLIGITKK